MKYLLAVIFSITLVSYSQDSSVIHRKILGYVEPYRKIDMLSGEPGLIAEVYVKEGVEIKKGDPVISLDTSVLEAQLRIAEVQAASNANILIATADYNVNRERYAKLSRLQKGGTAHASEVSRAKAEVQKAEGQLQKAQEEKSIAGFRVSEIKAQIERRILRSPIDGVVLEVNRDVGESATIQERSGEKGAALVRVAELDKLRLIVYLPANTTGKMKVGDEIPVLILKENSLKANREESSAKVMGKIEFLSPDINPASETVRTRIVIDNGDKIHRSGAHAYALLPKLEEEYSKSGR